ncbi:MAG: DUF362 domain-containing protein [Candidatus Omnitrophota bacterium]
MNKPIVYHISPRYTRYRYEDGLLGKFEKILKEIDLGRYIKKDEVVPIKVHLGNRGAFRTIRPQFIRSVVEAVKRVPGRPFVTDSARPAPIDYLEIANESGYNHLTLGAPVIIADGIYGRDAVKVKAGRLLKEVCVPSAIFDANSMIVLTHVKGHIQAVLGGAIKNVAMGGIASTPRGSGWHQGRGKIHFLAGEIMSWDKTRCVRCYDCVKICPVEAISFPDKKTYTVDAEECWRCGRCSRICPTGAITVPGSHIRFLEALAEGAAAVLSTFKKKKVFYVNFLLEMQPECDCMPVADPPVAQDQGILLSEDIVAIDTATLDILSRVKPLPDSRAEGLKMEKGKDIFSLLHKKDARLQVKFAEKSGLGSSGYRLIKI